MRGDCLSCSRISRCSETSVEKVLNDYTCVLYEPVNEPTYKARVDTMEKFGEVVAIRAMLDRDGITEPENE
jgi:hypothetical protein